MNHMMAKQNGYSSDCGAPVGFPYNRYQCTTGANEDEGSSGDLSFLYDRAQGNTYGPQSQGVATTQFSPTHTSPKITDHQSNYSAPPSCEYKPITSDLGQGLLRATPAPAYPYNPKRDVYPATGQPNAESLACPTGSYAGTNQFPSGSPPQAQHTDQPRRPDTLERQMSNLRVSNHNSTQSNSMTSPSSSVAEVPVGHQVPRPRLLVKTDPSAVPHPSVAQGVRTVERRPQKLSDGHYNPPTSSSTTLDPRRNHIRQNIPWRDINAARKFSVPILSRPRLQVAGHSSDDHMVNGGDHLHRPAQGEVDNSSQRQLLREGDEIGDYDQTSIRYKGRTNPSKIFRFVQSAMGSTDTDSIERHQNERLMRRRQKRDEMLSAAAAEDEKDALKDADDVVDISYVGPKIPSRTFRFLQEAIGARDQQGGYVSTPSPSVYNDFSGSPFDEQPPRRSVKVVHLRPQKSLENLIGDF